MTAQLGKSQFLSDGISAFAVLMIGFFVLPLAAEIQQGDLEATLNIVTSFSPTFPGSDPDFELAPTDLIPFNDGTGRLMVATLGGTIRVIDSSGNLSPEPLLGTSQTGLQLQVESGMTGIAAHPDFANQDTFGFGKLYTITTENPFSGTPDFGVSNARHQDVIREWDLSPVVGNPDVSSLPAVGLSDSREILRVDQPGSVHNLFDLAFNTSAQPDSDEHGLLYISFGDGGPNARASQNLGSIYGNILRIDPDPTSHSLVRISTHTGLDAYSISDDNPFNGDEITESTAASTLAETWVYGLRAPYRINFDSATGDLYEGDVGAGGFDAREEINVIEKAGNYGWPNREGTKGTHPPGGSIDPLFEYNRGEGRTVVGGFVYRGSAIPELVGKYVFAEFGQGLPSGRLFYGIVDPNDPDGNVGEFFEFFLDPNGPLFPIDTSGDLVPDAQGLLPDRIFSIGEDENGELYLVAGQDPRGHTPSVPGAFIVRLVPVPVPNSFLLLASGGLMLLFLRRRARKPMKFVFLPQTQAS